MSKDFKRKLILLFVPFLGYLVVNLIYLSCKKRYFLPKEELDEGACIIAFWHGKLLMQPFLYKKLRGSHKVATMISEHFDGEVLSRMVKFFGFDSIRGSSRKGAIKVLKEAFKMVAKGYDIGLTPDGPKGPRYSVADGIVAIAQKKDLSIVPCNFTASSFWRLKSWDGFMIPKPFSTIYLFADEPFKVTSLDKEDAKAKIKEALLKREDFSA
ncbi:MAG: lysophospholipid acyltransferase family protein [Epsilonproteobacteria bacterium]|nr:lysophospholipid acyltransferase family protein [Campylobacterota bacterium]